MALAGFVWGAKMHNREFYKRKADEHYRAYLAAIDLDDKQAAKKHEREYLNYKNMSEKK